MRIIPIFSGRTHKENESITDCQDYFQANEAKSCFAIADGASQSFYPSIWAELLVGNFCQNPEINQEKWNEWLLPIQKKWISEVEERVRKARKENRPIWVTNQNRLSFSEPATSTFIGLQFIENQVLVSIVGDSCLFILKETELKENYLIVKTYLLENSSDFNDRPEYFASYANHNKFLPSFFNIPLDRKKSPECLYFIVATDALSEYIFKCVEHEKIIFKTLLSISSQGKFENFVAQARNSGNIKMKNDDVALMILAVSDINIVPSSSQPTDITTRDSDEEIYINPKIRFRS